MRGQELPGDEERQRGAIDRLGLRNGVIRGTAMSIAPMVVLM